LFKGAKVSGRRTREMLRYAGVRVNV
jgi:hypothetical protein